MIKKEEKTIDIELPEEPKKINFVKYYVKPHNKVAREVTKDDLLDVLRDAHILYNLCYTQHGIHPGGFAVAHPQINDKDPLRFFVTKDEKIIINPAIVRHTNSTVDSQEGCLTFPDKYPIIVQRWNKCEVEYQTLDKNSELTEKERVSLSGLEARIFQHEIGHFDGNLIF